MTNRVERGLSPIQSYRTKVRMAQWVLNAHNSEKGASRFISFASAGAGPFESESGPFYVFASSSIVGGKIPYQSNSQTRSCSRGIWSLLTAKNPGPGNPVARSTTKDAIAGTL